MQHSQAPRTRDRLCWLFSLAWVGNLVAGMIPSLEYEPSPLATAPVMLILGAMFATGRRKNDDR